MTDMTALEKLIEQKAKLLIVLLKNNHNFECNDNENLKNALMGAIYSGYLMAKNEDKPV